MQIIKVLFFFYLWCFSELFVSCIENGSVFVGVVPGTDKFVWIIESDWIYFGLTTLKYDFWWTRARCIIILVEVLWPGSIYLIYLNNLFPCILFIDEQGTTDLFHPKTSTFSTRALIWVHFKTVHYFSQSIFSLFSYLKNA